LGKKRQARKIKGLDTELTSEDLYRRSTKEKVRKRGWASGGGGGGGATDSDKLNFQTHLGRRNIDILKEANQKPEKKEEGGPRTRAKGKG